MAVVSQTTSDGNACDGFADDSEKAVELRGSKAESEKKGKEKDRSRTEEVFNKRLKFLKKKIFYSILASVLVTLILSVTVIWITVASNAKQELSDHDSMSPNKAYPSILAGNDKPIESGFDEALVNRQPPLMSPFTNAPPIVYGSRVDLSTEASGEGHSRHTPSIKATGENDETAFSHEKEELLEARSRRPSSVAHLDESAETNAKGSESSESQEADDASTETEEANLDNSSELEANNDAVEDGSGDGK